jgi:hypothetical protein
LSQLLLLRARQNLIELGLGFFLKGLNFFVLLVGKSELVDNEPRQQMEARRGSSRASGSAPFTPGATSFTARSAAFTSGAAPGAASAARSIRAASLTPGRAIVIIGRHGPNAHPGYGQNA